MQASISVTTGFLTETSAWLCPALSRSWLRICGVWQKFRCFESSTLRHVGMCLAPAWVTRQGAEDGRNGQRVARVFAVSENLQQILNATLLVCSIRHGGQLV